MLRFYQKRRLRKNFEEEINKGRKLKIHSRSTSRLEGKDANDLRPNPGHDEGALESSSSGGGIRVDSRPDTTENSELERNLTTDLAIQLEDVKPTENDSNGWPTVLLIEACPGDDCSPRKWSQSRRFTNTLLVFGIVFTCGWSSAAHESANSRAAAEYHVSKEAETLATSMFLFGNAIGALLAGPISETIGRSASYLVFMFLYMVMVLITGLAPNYTVQIIFRFFAGLFASPPLTIYGGSLADMYGNAERSLVWPLFALSPILGPILAPIASGWLVQPLWLSWRWVTWLTLIISAFMFILALLFLEETYSPILLKWKAQSFRQLTSDPRFKSDHELGAPITQRLATNLKRPVIFFTREPIVIALGFYLTLIYVLVFTFLDGFTFIFTDIYFFTIGLRGTAFLSIASGVLINTAFTPLIRSHYLRHLRAASREQNIAIPSASTEGEEEPLLPPEIRLLPSLFSAPLFPISLFWLGWTNRPAISPWSNLLAATLLGFSLMGIFVSAYQYVIDSYETNSASALSSITFLRYIVAGGMVIAAMPMYQVLGVRWTMTLMGCLAVGLVPVPFLLWKYGDKVRAKSEYTKNF